MTVSHPGLLAQDFTQKVGNETARSRMEESISVYFASSASHEDKYSKENTPAVIKLSINCILYIKASE